MAGARKESCEKDTTSKETRIREIELYHREKEVAEREMVIMRRELELLRMSQRMDQKPNKWRRGSSDRATDTSGATNTISALQTRVNITAVADLLGDFNGCAEDFETWERQMRFLRTAFKLNDNFTKILIGTKLKKRTLEWFYSKHTSHIGKNVNNDNNKRSTRTTYYIRSKGRLPDWLPRNSRNQFSKKIPDEVQSWKETRANRQCNIKTATVPN